MSTQASAPPAAACSHSPYRFIAVLLTGMILALTSALAGRAHPESPLSANIERILALVEATAGRAAIDTQSLLPFGAAAAANTPDSSANPRAGQPMRFVHINPRAAPGGNGTYERPFRSLAEYEQLSAAQRGSYDVIYVHGGGPQQLTSTLALGSHQRLLSTAVPHTVKAAQGTFALPGYNPGSAKPTLLNLNGGDVIRLGNAGEVSGFRLNGSPTGSAIVGTNVSGFNINGNDFAGGLNGVALTTTAPAGTVARGLLWQNTFENQLNDGFQLTHFGPGTLDLDLRGNSATGSRGVAFNIRANGAPVHARIVRNRATGSGTGLALSAINGGVIDATVEENEFDDSTGTTGVSAFSLNRGALRGRP